MFANGYLAQANRLRVECVMRVLALVMRVLALQARKWCQFIFSGKLQLRE